MAESKPNGAKLLDSIAERLHAEIRELSDEELSAITKASKRANSRNCWWARFVIAPAILELAKEECRDRGCRQANTAAEVRRLAKAEGRS